LKISKLVLIAGILVASVTASIQSSEAETRKNMDHRFDYGIEVQDYTWEEFFDDNSRLVKEQGYLYALTCDYDSKRNILGWRTGADFFIGPADYDGHTWSFAPVKTDVLYLGSQFYSDIVPNYRFDFGLLVKGFAGIGFRGWYRDLKDTHTQEGLPVNGSKEWWWSVYGRAGGGASFPVTADIEIFSEAGLKLPIYAENRAEFFVSGNPTVTLEQKQTYSPFGNVGVRWKKLSVKFTYDTLRFDRSDSVYTDGYVLYQPKSKADIYGLNVTWSMWF
jgi:hypothetical protein